MNRQSLQTQRKHAADSDRTDGEPGNGQGAVSLPVSGKSMEADREGAFHVQVTPRDPPSEPVEVVPPRSRTGGG